MKYFLLLSFTFACLLVDAQNLSKELPTKRKGETSLALITGYQGFKNHFLELGIGARKDWIVGHHPLTMVYGVSGEFKLHDDFIGAVKGTISIGGGASGMNLGLNLVNYVSANSSSFRFRPEIGVGVRLFRIVYGYNVAFTNENFPGISQHVFTLNIYPKLGSIK